MPGAGDGESIPFRLPKILAGLQLMATVGTLCLLPLPHAP